MRKITQVIVGLGGLLLVCGCRTATRVAEVPRVDLEMSGGNRGYLIGTPSEAPQLQTTRQMVETTLEVPSFYKPKRSGAPAIFEKTELSDSTTQAAASITEAQGPFDSYVVQKGDSLWSIAAKKEIYGKATAWRRIFDANRSLLKSPDRLKAGMTLKIPRGDQYGDSTTYGDEGTTFKK
jgi:nucleoid-associated protein YgaU